MVPRPAMKQASMTEIMIVLIRVAAKESISWTPILAKMAVRAAKPADISAHGNHDFDSSISSSSQELDRGPALVPDAIRNQSYSALGQLDDASLRRFICRVSTNEQKRSLTISDSLTCLHHGSVGEEHNDRS